MTMPLRPDDGSFLAEVERLSEVPVSACFHCQKCANGCPVAYAMDIAPTVLIRLMQLGQRARVLQSETIWVCASCITCSTRCPNDIDLAHVMDTLRRMSIREGSVSLPHVRTFHEAFLNAIRTHGRVHELELVTRYKLKTMTFFEDMKLGQEMLLRGRMRFLPERIKGRKEVRDMLSPPPARSETKSAL
ncbi:MAG: heterodisulfide reductase [Deltaproteobacteria bacterium]|nr:heterodisulfide reductase [Deltaproteobacteria bacterium]